MNRKALLLLLILIGSFLADDPNPTGDNEPSSPGGNEPSSPGDDEPSSPGGNEPSSPGDDEPVLYDDCSGFEAIKITGCQNLKESGRTCTYSAPNTCVDNYADCGDYTLTEGVNEINKDICSKIISANPNKKCEANSAKTLCQSVPKECGDYKDKGSCLAANNLDEGYSCRFIDNTCKLHKDTCADLDSSKCNGNIPKEYKDKCFWTGSACDSKKRSCSEYTVYKDFGVLCKQLSASEGHKCILDEDNDRCYEELADCGDFQVDSNKNDEQNGIVCATYKKIDTDNKLDHLNKCEYKLEPTKSCASTLKVCTDYKEGEDDKYCESFHTADSSKSRCFLENNKCKEKYISCEGYNDVAQANRKAEECEAIIPYIINQDNSIEVNENNKCVFDEKEKSCGEEPKECSEIKDKDICISHVLNDNKKGNKRCVYKDNKCQEQYRTCEKYKNDATNKNKNKADCEAIENEGDYSSKCVWTGENPQCETKTKECKDYKSDQPEDYCNLISLNDTHRCVFVDNKCIEQYKTCSIYSEKEDIKIRTICESIIPLEQNKRCILKEDIKCEAVKKECSDYKGDKKDECETNYAPLDDDYKCVFKDNKCVEQSVYTSCSAYRGKDKDICESIIPLRSNGETDTYSIKCLLQNGVCSRVEKPCSDGKSAVECLSIIPMNSNKICVFTENKCIEQYKTCALYEGDSTVKTIDENTCKKIISTDNKVCKYTKNAGENNRGTCIGEAKKCNDFNAELYQTQCTDIQLKDNSKKCVYNIGGTCEKTQKNCLELTFESTDKDVETICQNAPTEDANKICSINSDKTGCNEIDKPKEETTTPTSKPTTKPSTTDKGAKDNQEDTNNYENKQYLNKLLIIILCLLF